MAFDSQVQRVDVQRQYQQARNNDDEAYLRFNEERELWEGERSDLLRKMKELNRKIEELEDELKINEDQTSLLKKDIARIQRELENE